MTCQCESASADKRGRRRPRLSAAARQKAGFEKNRQVDFLKDAYLFSQVPPRSAPKAVRKQDGRGYTCAETPHMYRHYLHLATRRAALAGEHRRYGGARAFPGWKQGCRHPRFQPGKAGSPERFTGMARRGRFRLPLLRALPKPPAVPRATTTDTGCHKVAACVTSRNQALQARHPW